ncbi:PIAS1 [Cordylochernes scorpioides]|uniref:PIAS1 n=1 Tax=Cordylochernes scorpioides TaxID=51811 RepID=A0ABY6KAA9_9ARAC|nr:PIAS1 [Cordylochernes scorpioides]
MVLYFRVSELQVLLGFAGRNKSGKKHELQSRALELLKLQSGPIQMKIRELHNTCQLEIANHCAVSSAQLKNVSAYAVPRPSLPQQNPNLLPRSAMPYNSYGMPPKQLMPPLASAPQAPYPINPDVRLKPLPFYDVIDELLRPASLLPTGSGRYQESTFTFNLTPTQATHVGLSRENSKGEHQIQIQLRFCLLETSCEQEDNFPPSICVKVNQKICNLPPGVEPKRPSRPVNITPYCRLCPTNSNVLTVSWASEFGRAYTVSVYLVKKLSSSTLLQRLRMRGLKNADHTRAMIKEKLTQDPDSEIATTSLRGSLMCPLGKMRMQVPSRSSTCTHLQCFDASLYIQMNEKKPTWICPVCDKPATFNNLIIDGLFQEITQSAPSECVEVQFHESGNWSPIYPKKESPPSSVATTSPIKITATKRESKEQAGREKKKSKVEAQFGL